MQILDDPPDLRPRAPRRLRAQITDPISGRRVNVYGDDEPGLAHRVKRIRDIRDDLKAGVISKSEAVSLCKPLYSGPMLMGAAFERYIATQHPDSQPIAKANWKSRLRKWFAHRAPQELSREVMAAWESDLQHRGDASATIKNSYDHLAACCRMLVDSGELDALPWGEFSRARGGSGWRPSKVVAKKQRRAVATIHQLKAFLDVAKADDMTHWARGEYSDRYILLIVLFLVGLRQAEACALSWNLISLDSEPAILRIAYQAKRGWRKKAPEGQPRQPTKTRKEDSHHLHPSVVLALKAQRAELVHRGWYRDDGPVFPGKSGEFRRSGSVIKPERIRKYAKASGMPFWEDWVTHSTRHSFATLEIVASGGDLKATQARTRHADVRQLEGYLHAAGQFLGQSAIPAIDVQPPSFALLPGGVGDVVAADPWGIEQIPAARLIERVGLKEANHWAAERRRERAERSARLDIPLADIAQKWIKRGHHLKPPTRSGFPPEVIRAGELSASRNYIASQRAGKSKPECQRSARHGRNCVKGAWTKALRKALGNTSPAPPENPDR